MKDYKELHHTYELDVYPKRDIVIVKGKNARTLKRGRTQENIISQRKREHSRKPDEQYKLIESCSPGPYLELFARGERKKWTVWGNQANGDYNPDWETYKNHSQAHKKKGKK